jgi:alpha-galactosidase
MNRIIAYRLGSSLDDAGLPNAAAWVTTDPVAYCSDWRGEIADAGRETQVRMLWSEAFLYLRFDCRFREIYVYDGGNSRRDKLWDRDVAEAFIRPPENAPGHYLEFEISPNGDWLDLDIAPGDKTILYCDLKSRVVIDANARLWTAALAIPMNCLTASFNPKDVWRINLFRIEGSEPDRYYSAWQPTHTPRPNFHVPEAFGELHFAPQQSAHHGDPLARNNRD